MIRKLSLSLIFSVILFILSYAPSFAMDLYVAVNGNDSNDGLTLSTPLATLDAAKRKYTNLGAAGTQTVNIYLRGGTYNFSAPVSFGSLNSGTASFPINIQPYNNEVVNFSGGRTLTGWQTVTVNGITAWRTTIPTDITINTDTIPHQLYLNGVRQPRSTGSLGSTQSSFAGGIKTATAINAATHQDMEAFLDLSWLEYRCAVDHIDGQLIYLKTSCFDPILTQSANTTQNWDANHAGFENAEAFLDTPGEWYVSSANRTITYVPKAGATISSSTFTIPVINNILTFSGDTTGGVKTGYINVKNITFLYSGWAGVNTLGIHNWGAVEAGGAIIMGYADHITLDSVNVNHTGGMGIIIKNNSGNITVLNSKISDTSGTGIYIYKSGTDGAINISNNSITNVGVEYHSSMGIIASTIDNTRIEHNTIDGVPYSGINYGCDSSTTTDVCLNNYIGSNLIKTTNQKLVDGGGIYTSNANGDPTHHTIVEKNYLTLGHGYFDMYLDHGSMYNTVNSNVIFNNWIKDSIAKGGNNLIQNNFSDGTWSPPIDNFPCVINNITVDCGSNTYTNNATITSLSGTALTIANSAGVQAVVASPTPSPSPIAGDFNGDGHVNYSDYGIITTSFGNPYTIYDYNNLVSNYLKY